MKKILTGLFEFQKYESNPALQAVIDDVHARHTVRELSLDELEGLAAAGAPEINLDKKRKPLI